MTQILFIFICIFFTPLNRGTERTSWIIPSKRSDRRLVTTRVNVNSFLAVDALLIVNSNALITDPQLLNANLLLQLGKGLLWSLINVYMVPSALACFTASTNAENDFLNTGANIRMSNFKLGERETYERPLMYDGPTDRAVLLLCCHLWLARLQNVYFVMQYTLFAKSFLFHYQNITVTR